MSSPDQASSPAFPPGFGCARGVAAIVLPLSLLLGGCMTGGLGLDELAPDRSIKTSGVPPSDKSSEPAELLDQTIIRNAVSATDPEALGSASLPWANPETGARGEIFAIAEAEKDGQMCRRFKASRENFQGVALYDGETCLTKGGAWWMRSFVPS